MVVSRIGGPQDILSGPQKGTPNFEKPHIGSVMRQVVLVSLMVLHRRVITCQASKASRKVFESVYSNLETHTVPRYFPQTTLDLRIRSESEPA